MTINEPTKKEPPKPPSVPIAISEIAKRASYALISGFLINQVTELSLVIAIIPAAVIELILWMEPALYRNELIAVSFISGGILTFYVIELGPRTLPALLGGLFLLAIPKVFRLSFSILILSYNYIHHISLQIGTRIYEFLQTSLSIHIDYNFETIKRYSIIAQGIAAILMIIWVIVWFAMTFN